MSVRAFKPSREAFQADGECTNIFITSITPKSPSQPLDCLTAQVLLSFLGPLDL